MISNKLAAASLHKVYISSVIFKWTTDERSIKSKMPHYVLSVKPAIVLIRK